MIEVKGIRFTDKEHLRFFCDSMKKVNYKDEYHVALCYCLGLNEDTRAHIDDIYDFNSGCVKPECLHMGWQTSGSVRVVRMAFNLYCNGMPTLTDEMTEDEMRSECSQYSVENLFCCSYALYFFEAIRLRYPDYTDTLKSWTSLLDSIDSIDTM